MYLKSSVKKTIKFSFKLFGGLLLLENFKIEWRKPSAEYGPFVLLYIFGLVMAFLARVWPF